MRLFTAEAMRALDRATIERGTPGPVLMERAGLGVVDAMECQWGPMLAMRVLFLCGPGNNGGDGFVAARHLAARGADVHAGLVGDRARVRGDARTALERLEADGLAIVPANDAAALRALAARRDGWDFAIDALLGTGARGAPEGAIAEAIAVLDGLAGTRRVAIDLPSGVDADTGAAAAAAVHADLTVTFGAWKRGHALFPGRALCGRIDLVDIGLVDAAPEETPARLATAAEMGALLPRRDPRAHKGSVGRVLVVGGSPGLTGAVTLAARAATRAGAGYVQAAVPKGTSAVLATKLTEEMAIACEETAAGALALGAEPEIRRLAERADVVVLGSGLGRDEASAELARRLALGLERAIVLDADGLNAFEGRGDALAEARGRLAVTPHLGEMARLTGRQAAELDLGRIDEAREWSSRWRCAVVLKGAPTVTADSGGAPTVNATGNPGMATAGMGDVLSGVIAALAGQGLAIGDAARLGVYLHGLAGDLVAARRGAIGMRASDVIETLPLAIRELDRGSVEDAWR